MGEAVNNVGATSKSSSQEVVAKKSRFKSLKSEFKKIIWPDRPTLIKQTIAVIVISVIVGALIVGVDTLYKMAFHEIGIFGVLGQGDKMAETNWYVVHTYSGYENKVKANIEKTIENRNLQDQILEVSVPMQEVVEMKNGSKKKVSKKMFPAYVLINMVMNDDTWYVVRNTRGVTGFVGPGSKPVPLSEAEMRSMGLKSSSDLEIDLEVGDSIVVVAGAWEDTSGIITHINNHKQVVTINVDMFGRETPVEISFTDVKKLQTSRITRWWEGRLPITPQISGGML